MRKTSPVGFFFGRVEFRADLSDGAKLLNLFREYGIIYRDFGEDGEGGVRFTVGTVGAAFVSSACRKGGIKVCRMGAAGLPHLIYKYRKRWGIAAGGALALALMLLSNDYLWDIRVDGNERVTYSYVVNALSESGFRVGARLDSLDIDRTETLVLLGSDEISWMSINMNGTVAEVQIREATVPPETEEKRHANIIAARDGQVEYFELFSGEPAVKEGSAVRKGELLVSGVRDEKLGGFTVGRAEGKVFAVTERVFNIEVPLEYEKKSATESRTVGKYVIFFSKEIKIFKRNTPNSENCDTIDNASVFRFFGGARLPFGIRTEKEVTYETSIERYSDAEAMDIAYYRLSRELESELSEAQILKKTVTSELTEDAYILNCTVRCIENIGQSVEFDAE